MTTTGDADRPRVIVSVTTSVDGRVTLRRDRLLMDADAARTWASMRPPSTQAVEDAMAARLAGLYGPRAVLEGSGTFVLEDAGPAGLPAEFAEPPEVLYTDFLPAEVVERPGHEKWFAVVDGRGRTRWTMTSDGGMDLLLLTARSTPPEYLAYLRGKGIPYLVAGADRVDLGGALRCMRDRLGVTCVVSNAGGGLNGALLRAGLVDEIQLLVLPAAIGGRDTPAVFDGAGLADGESPTPLRLLSVHAEADGVIALRYEVVRSS